MSHRTVLPASLVFAIAFFGGAPRLPGAFIRGDTNADGQVDLSDPVKTLGVLFLGGSAEPCDDAADGNDDGRIDISDPVYVLNHLFLGGGAPPAPYPDCGDDLRDDALSCDSYPACADCLDASDIDALVGEQVGAGLCIPAGETELTVDPFIVGVCPLDAAPSCGEPGSAGCPIEFTRIDGSLDIPGRRVVVAIGGQVPDLPIVITTTFGTRADCSVVIDFSGSAVVPFTAQAGPGGTLVVTDVGQPTIEDSAVTMDASGGLVCDLLESQQDQFIGEVIAQLEAAAGDLIAELRPELVGQTLCAP